MYNRARIYKQLENRPAAIKDLEDALSLDPNCKQAEELLPKLRRPSRLSSLLRKFNH
jgi:regulator of sirC expression with transglutaminase-like and TPR domain